MRLIKSSIERRDGSGHVVLIPEEPEDMWHTFNLLRPNDLLTASALRNVATESATGTRTVRKHTTLTIRVRSTDFDPAAGALHVAGVVARENSFVKMGAHHTLDLELQRQFTLTKGGDAGSEPWDSVAVETLREACDERKRATAWAVVMHEGLANICVVTEHQTVLRQRVEVAMTRKRRGQKIKMGGGRDKDLEKFFRTLLGTLTRAMELSPNEDVPPVLLASPGYTATVFRDYIRDEATRTGDKALRALSQAVTVAHSSNGYVSALNEVLKSKAVLARLSDTKYAKETALMARFSDMLRQDDGRAWYGPREVERAVERGAVGRGGGVLLISDALFRSFNVGERKRWVSLVERVREVEGGEVRVLSSMHDSGKRLQGLGNIAAILTYPIDDLDESEGEEGNVPGDGGVEI